MDKKAKARELYNVGFSISKISQILKVSKSTVWEWLYDERVKENPTQLLAPKELKEKVKALLTTRTEEKGRTRVLSFSQIYRILREELNAVGINNRAFFYRWLKAFIKEEYGGLEKLERRRRSLKEMPAFRQPKAKVRREPGVIEIDATGYTWRGKNYFILLAREIWSGFFFEPYLLEVKETTARHYNKALDQYDVAKFLINIFSTWGLTYKVKTDNELTLKSELITRGLAELGVELEHVPPYSPNSKLIERAIRDLKALIREQEAEDFENALLRAIQQYNEMEHQFENFDKPIIPAFMLRQVELKPVKQEKLRFAFAERFIRKVINNTITIDNQRYEFHCDRADACELGRKAEYPEVVAVRFLDDLSRLIVYDREFAVKLGEAVLFTEKAPEDVHELKEGKAQVRRVLRRKKKLTDELERLEQALPEPKIEQTGEDILQALAKGEAKPEKEATQEDFGTIDLIKLFSSEDKPFVITNDDKKIN
jgi:predicted transcriptional regulator